MKCWVLYKKADVEKNRWYIEQYAENCKKRNIDMKLIIEDKAIFTIKKGSLVLDYEGKTYHTPDFAVNRTRDFRVGKLLENAGVTVFNNSFVTEVCNDKMMTLSYLSKYNIKVCDTALKGKISDAPFILKSVSGHGGSEVFMIKNNSEYENAVEKIKCDYITQKIVSEKGKDLRVYVIGKSIVAAMLRTNNDDFRSNFSLGGNAQVYNLSDNERKYILKIIDLFDFGLVGIDFIFDNGEMILNEIEDAVGARMLYEYTDIDIVKLYFDYIEEKMKG